MDEIRSRSMVGFRQGFFFTILSKTQAVKNSRNHDNSRLFSENSTIFSPKLKISANFEGKRLNSDKKSAVLIKTQPKLKDFFPKLKLFFSKLNFPASPLDVLANEWVKKNLCLNSLDRICPYFGLFFHLMSTGNFGF